MSNILPVPTPKDIALFFNERDGKVIETATLATGAITNKTIGSSNVISGAALSAGSVALASLAAGISPAFVIKFMKLGSTITTTALTGLAVGDIVIRIEAAGTVVVALCATINTLPADPADTDWVLVLRAAA
jgi:hypothetical protein